MASLETLKWLSLPSAVLVLLVAWPFLRSLRLALLVLATASFCQCAGLALVYFSGGQMNGMLAVMPILVLVIFVSGSVHLINYYRDALPYLGAAEAPIHAVRVGWLPCTMAIGTTALGIGSLAFGHVRPVQLFGVYASLCMILVLASLLIVLPGSLVLTARYEAAHGKIPSKPGHGRFPSRLWKAVAIPISRYHGGRCRGVDRRDTGGIDRVAATARVDACLGLLLAQDAGLSRPRLARKERRPSPAG